MEPSVNAHLTRAAWLWHSIVAWDLAPVGYALRMRWHGLDLAAQGCRELGLPSDRAKAHAASGGPLLERVLNTLAIPSGSRVVDLGSGKGGAAITLSRYFADVVGVELSPELVEIAKANIRKLRLPNVQFTCGDAGGFVDLHRFDYVYMFDPFPQRVMAEVASNLRKARVAYGRPGIVIYKNPVLEQELLSTGWRKKTQFPFRDSRPFGVYCASDDPGAELRGLDASLC
jgi:protein-L-isoaspartate O-methyltransferase